MNARAARAFPWHSILKGGAQLSFGSDWSVVTLNPWPGVQMLLTRETPEGTPAGGWHPDERLSLEEARKTGRLIWQPPSTSYCHGFHRFVLRRGIHGLLGRGGRIKSVASAAILTALKPMIQYPAVAF